MHFPDTFPGEVVRVFACMSVLLKPVSWPLASLLGVGIPCSTIWHSVGVKSCFRFPFLRVLCLFLFVSMFCCVSLFLALFFVLRNKCFNISYAPTQWGKHQKKTFKE